MSTWTSRAFTWKTMLHWFWLLTFQSLISLNIWLILSGFDLPLSCCFWRSIERTSGWGIKSFVKETKEHLSGWKLPPRTPNAKFGLQSPVLLTLVTCLTDAWSYDLCYCWHAIWASCHQDFLELHNQHFCVTTRPLENLPLMEKAPFSIGVQGQCPL